ncbi:MAG: SusC/RagA family TonB-linked outer membrane protein, partial [Candidatus Cryptobacteroides sp.]
MNPTIKLINFLTAMLVVGAAMSFSPDASAQVVLKGDNLTAVEALSYLQQHSDYVFFYSSDDISGIKARSYDLEGSIESVLMEIFKGTDVTWRIQADKMEVYIKKNQEAPKADESTVRTVSGIVVDGSDKSPLIGATVHKKGTNDVAITDLDGKFTMEGVTNRTILEVSFLGFKQRDFRVGDLGYLEIDLTSDNELDGVVVVGAGTQKKVSVTGSITAVKGDQLKATSSSLTSNLAGQLAGLVSVTKSGKPGEGSEFYIRGVGTFGGRATPLILLDGIEITSEALDRIPPESIDQFSILKDASATAIYGSRGANGVMIITTKEGQENTKAQVTATVECSVLQPTNQMEYVDGARWMEIYNEVLTSRSPQSSPRYSQEMIDNTRSGVNPYMFPNVDWYELLFKKFTSNQKANVNVQGGGSKLTYYMGIQANHDTGLINCPKDYVYDNNYNRWDFIFQNNINYQITNTTKVSLK